MREISIFSSLSRCIQIVLLEANLNYYRRRVDRMVFRISTKYKIYITLIILISISVSSCDSNSNSFLNFRRYCSNTCYCPKRDFWRSKYSEDVKFSLLSYEYRTHLKGNTNIIGHRNIRMKYNLGPLYVGIHTFSTLIHI